MIEHPEKVRELEAAYDHARYAAMSPEEKLAIYSAMWQQAREAGLLDFSNWEEDVKADIELARVLGSQPLHD